MRPVSITDFIKIIHGHDSCPPSPVTVRAQCRRTDEEGRPLIPGAYKAGKPWKIDLDVYIPEMNRRIRGLSPSEQDHIDSHEEEFLDDLATQLAT